MIASSRSRVLNVFLFSSVVRWVNTPTAIVSFCDNVRNAFRVAITSGAPIARPTARAFSIGAKGTLPAMVSSCLYNTAHHKRITGPDQRFGC